MVRLLNVVFRITIIALLLCAVGCGKTPRTGDYLTLDDRPVMSIPADKGVVCFVREDAFIGGGVSYLILENNAEIGALKSGTYFVYEAAEGKHTFSAETESETFITVDVKNGQASYIVGGITMGAFVGRPSLDEITEDTAMRLLEDDDIRYIRRRTPEELEAWKAKKQKKRKY